ncbi:GntR family transcriptional regulator [Roseomonas sp. KE0001]|uniref:GntR family transcriptional regulator n=1 Tax=Roseomonas sp. KE0001 TaxID=2479201 RepID=UPI0018DF0F94|nr:GntR family transcriptional regulator [Roseomonas sp. KE0001]MBI0434576.1 GntR family transcriptional regulator [Roseomonas sp. KE0001]
MNTRSVPPAAPRREADPGFTRISRDSVSGQAYQAIRSALMLSRLRPGERLLLRPLAEQLGISATPVREALLRLVSEQALQLDERGTVFVPVIDRARFLEIRSLRCNLEGQAAAAAASRAGAEQIDRLAAIHERLAAAEAERDFGTAIQSNEAFHSGLCRLGGMPVLLGLVEILWMQCGPLLSHLYDRGPLLWPRHGHLSVLDALRRGDAAGARAAVIRDIEEGGRPLLDILA